MKPLYLALALLALLTGCAKPKPQRPPDPPAIPEHLPKSYPKQTARPGDMAIHGCTVTQEEGNRADCICRRASTKIDAHDPAKQSLVCK